MERLSLRPDLLRQITAYGCTCSLQIPLQQTRLDQSRKVLRAIREISFTQNKLLLPVRKEPQKDTVIAVG